MSKTRAVVRSLIPLRFGRVAIVVSRWNEMITKRMMSGALKVLQDHGITEEGVDTFWVAGSYELPQAASRLAKSGNYRTIIPIGCLIRGETAHFEIIAQAVASGLDAVGRETGVAVSFGVLTVDTLDQALARSGGDQGNKGEDAAIAAIDLALLTEKE